MAAVLANKRKREAGDLGAQRAAPGLSDNAFDQHTHFDIPSDHNMEFVAQHNADFGNPGESQQDHDQTGGSLDHGDNQGQSASDTAAAAMAQYHTMTVPQSTEQAFMTHAGDGSDRPGSSSLDQGGAVGQRFPDFDMVNLKNDQNPGNGDTSPTLNQNGNQKPSVGSEEWHKVRRDNHKEGKLHPPYFVRC